MNTLNLFSTKAIVETIGQKLNVMVTKLAEPTLELPHSESGCVKLIDRNTVDFSITASVTQLEGLDEFISETATRLFCETKKAGVTIQLIYQGGVLSPNENFLVLSMIGAACDALDELAS